MFGELHYLAPNCMGTTFLASGAIVSQAIRLLARFDRFKEVVLDFRGIDSIGQAFADEVFRVFQNQHPEIKLHPINMRKQVKNRWLAATEAKA